MNIIFPIETEIGDKIVVSDVSAKIEFERNPRDVEEEKYDGQNDGWVIEDIKFSNIRIFTEKGIEGDEMKLVSEITKSILEEVKKFAIEEAKNYIPQ